MRWIKGGRLRRAVLVIGSCLAVAAGTLVATWWLLGSAYWLWGCAVLAAISLRRHNMITLACLVVLFFGIGWWRGSDYMQKVSAHQALHFKKVTVVGTATEDAVYATHSQLEFSLTNVAVVSPSRAPLVGNLTIRGFGEPMVYRGDRVLVTGKLYPTRGNNLASISFAGLDVVQPGSSWIDELRRNFGAGIQSALPEPNASFALGLLIGQRSTLPEETNEQLREVGLTHIIAVSGANLTIIVTACRRLLANRSKYQATITCLSLIGFFLLITGSSPPIVRAGIISVLGIWAWYYGRTVQALVLLLVGAAVSILINPLYLWGNVSWYLSFLAFFGVLVVAPLVYKRLYGDKEPKILLGIAIETLCATIMVEPYVLHIFGQVSVVSLLANVLVIPFIPLAMLLSAVAGLAGMLLPDFSGWLAWPANWLLTYMLDIAGLLGRLPFAFVEGISFSLPAMLFGYGCIGAVCLLLWYKTKQRDGIITDRTTQKEGAV